MRLLALDQSTKHTGWSIWENGTLKKHGVYDIHRPNKYTSTDRMLLMYNFTKTTIKDNNIDAVVFEQCQYQANMLAFRTLAQLGGTLMGLCFELDLPFIILEPSAWRSKIGISGKQKEVKAQAIAYVSKEFGVEVSDDEAEAILIGLVAYDMLNGGN